MITYEKIEKGERRGKQEKLVVGLDTILAVESLDKFLVHVP